MATIPSIAMIPSGYKASKVYSVLPTDGAGDLTFSRAGALPSFNATRVNSDGLIEEVLSNVPRLDYSDGGCPSLLIEPQSTNLLTYSEDFSNASWVKTATTITANTTTSPDGTLNGDTLLANGAASTHLLQSNSVSYVSGVSSSFSVFAKKGTNNFMQLIAPSSVGGMFANFDLNNGVVGTLGTVIGTSPTSSIQDFGNGWYRCIINFTPTATSSSINTIAIVSSSSAVRAEPNTLSTSIIVWGAQLEALPYASSYIPTVASTVTRVADVVSKTGISSLIGQTEGTLFTDFKVNSLANFGTLISVNSNSLSNFIYVTVSSSGQLRVQVFNGAIQADIYSTVVVGNRYKLAFGYKTNDFVLYINGVLIGSDVSGTTFSGTTLDRFDYNITIPTTFAKASVSINSSALWKERLSNETLTQLTTL
jgi:hypothetical protein